MFVRPSHWPSPFPHDDAILLKGEIERLGAKTILEFGPGESTAFFSGLGYEIATCEHDPHWHQVAVDRFKDNPKVRVFKYENEMPIPPIEGLAGRFDVGFVDTPQGYMAARKVLKGYEDCNRLNTALYALKHCDSIFLHDVARPLERCTLERLNREGFRFQIIEGKVARIWHQRKPT